MKKRKEQRRRLLTLSSASSWPTSLSMNVKSNIYAVAKHLALDEDEDEAEMASQSMRPSASPITRENRNLCVRDRLWVCS